MSVAARDPTGAGDVFAAAFAAERCRGASLAAAASYANAAAAASTRALGPMSALPADEEVRRLMASVE